MTNEIMANDKNNQLGMVQESRQLAEVKAKIFLAKQFPRDEVFSLQKILQECTRPKLAELATYSYQRGDTVVKGPSIRLAEVIARHWGNIESAVIELEQRNGESSVMTYAWDLETNYRDDKVFTVKHERGTKKGNYTLTDPRDIYEMVANNAARRKRSNILAVVPGYVVDEAIEACQKTLEATMSKGEDLETTKAKMLDAFKVFDERIDKAVLETKIGKEYDKFNVKDVVKMRNLYNAINDGFVKAAIAFEFEKEDLPTTEEDEQLEKLNQSLVDGATNE